jgi:hypothetical protein
VVTEGSVVAWVAVIGAVSAQDVMAKLALAEPLATGGFGHSPPTSAASPTDRGQAKTEMRRRVRNAVSGNRGSLQCCSPSRSLDGAAGGVMIA